MMIYRQIKKRIFLACLLITASFFVNAQSTHDNQHEVLANFTSELIDYEIYNEEIVALTKKNRQYFIYFTDSKGAKLFETFEMFFPTDLEIDCMGNLFVVGVDSSVQIKITDYITRVQSLDAIAYEKNIKSCRALFNESIVRTAGNNSLIFEPIDDSVFAKHPVLYTIQVWTSNRGRPADNAPNPYRVSQKDQHLVENRRLNLVNDGLNQPVSRPNSNTSTQRKTYRVADDLSGFQVGENLWVVDETEDLLFIFDQYGKTDGRKKIKGLGIDFTLEQDRETQELFFITNDGLQRIIQQINENGELVNEIVFPKGLSRSSLKISNGFLYFRDSKGTVKSIQAYPFN